MRIKYCHSYYVVSLYNLKHTIWQPMIKKSVTLIDVYPAISRFTDKYCIQCKNDCEVPSLEMFACVLKKLNNKERKEVVKCPQVADSS